MAAHAMMMDYAKMMTEPWWQFMRTPTTSITTKGLQDIKDHEDDYIPTGRRDHGREPLKKVTNKPGVGIIFNDGLGHSKECLDCITHESDAMGSCRRCAETNLRLIGDMPIQDQVKHGHALFYVINPKNEADEKCIVPNVVKVQYDEWTPMYTLTQPEVPDHKKNIVFEFDTIYTPIEKQQVSLQFRVTEKKTGSFSYHENFETHLHIMGAHENLYMLTKKQLFTRDGKLLSSGSSSIRAPLQAREIFQTSIMERSMSRLWKGANLVTAGDREGIYVLLSFESLEPRDESRDDWRSIGTFDPFSMYDFAPYGEDKDAKFESFCYFIRANTRLIKDGNVKGFIEHITATLDDEHDYPLKKAIVNGSDYDPECHPMGGYSHKADSNNPYCWCWCHGSFQNDDYICIDYCRLHG